MKHILFFRTTCLAVATIFFEFAFAQTALPQPAAYNQKLQSSSLLFMENKGQVTDAKGNLRPDILFTANSAGAKLYLSANAIHYQFTKTEYPKGYDPHKREPSKDLVKEAELQKQIKTSTHRFSLELQGANQHPKVNTEKQTEYTENYFLAHCPDGITGVHGYEKIIYKNVYPNIDWVIYSKGGFMEYDFLVHPGGNPAQIKLKVKDAESVSITAAGELLMKTSLGEVREKAPLSFVDGAVVETHFKQLGDGMIGFDVQPQPDKELRIDPAIVWSTYYGGAGGDGATATATDNLNNIYLAGNTNSTAGIASGGFQNAFGGGNTDGFLVKFSNSGNRLWATYYGGPSAESLYACTVDGSGNVYIGGHTSSASGIASGGFQNTFIGGPVDVFLVKFNNSGNRLWGTYYGGPGDDNGRSCITDNAGNVYLAGYTESTAGIASGGFQNAISGAIDAFLVKFNSSGICLWATYYGGPTLEYGYACAVDGSNNVYLAGRTYSNTGIASGGSQNTFGGFADAFLAKFSSSGSRIWATYFGGFGDEFGLACTVNKYGNVYLAGQTHTTFGLTTGGFQNSYSGGDYDAFMAAFNSNGNRLWSTYYGGNDYDVANGCTADSSGDVYMSGVTYSVSNIPYQGFDTSYNGGGDGFVVKFSGSTRVWSSYFGGTGYEPINACAVDKNGNVFVAGQTNSSAGIAAGGFQNTIGGGVDAYLAKINGSNNGNPVFNLCPSGSYALTANLTGTTYQWQINTGSGFMNLSDNANYTGSSTATLQLINLPSGFYGYQYRSIINMADTSQVYQLQFANTWIGTTNSTWENPANWSCGSLPDGNTDVIINTGPVTLNSNGICRTLTVRPGVSFTVAAGNTLTITH